MWQKDCGGGMSCNPKCNRFLETWADASWWTYKATPKGYQPPGNRNKPERELGSTTHSIPLNPQARPPAKLPFSCCFVINDAGN